MPSTKKPRSKKRASLPRSSDFTREFVKDWKRLSKTGRYDMVKLKEAMLLLVANDNPLPAEYKDHQLKGEFSDLRECHIGGDFLLMYLADDESVQFIRAGTHSELFE